MELHKWEQIIDPKYYEDEIREKHLNFLRSFDGVIYMKEITPEVPACQRYPRKEAQKLCGDKRRFNSSFDWMAALAILEEVDKAIIIGFEMDYFETEYRYQKPSALYWLRAMEDAGIEVEDHCLFPERKLYAYEDAQMIARHTVEANKKKYQQQMTHFLNKMQYWKGMYDAGGGNRSEAAQQVELYKLSAAQAQGAVKAFEDLLDEYDKDGDA
jgi:hypothetical protein